VYSDSSSCASSRLTPLVCACTVFVSSDSKQLLFSTTVKVDEVDHQVDVRDGDNPVQVALKFANAHKIGQAGFEKVLLHLKQRALVTGHMKRVFFALPVRAEKDKTQQVGPQCVRTCAHGWAKRIPPLSQVLNLTIYEDTEPEILAKKVSELYGLNAGQQAKLAATIEREMVTSAPRAPPQPPLHVYRTYAEATQTSQSLRQQHTRHSLTHSLAHSTDLLLRGIGGAHEVAYQG
jgi:hypothetical protein